MKRTMTIAGVTLVACAIGWPAFAGTLELDTAQSGNKLMIEPGGRTPPPAAAQAQPGTQNGNTDAGTASDVDIGKTQAGGAAPSVDDVLSAMNGSAAAVSTIKSMTTVSKVHVVRVGALPEADDTPSLDSAIEANRSQIDNLQGAIRTNTNLTAMLDRQKVDVSEIIATRTGDDGSLTVYTK